MSFTFFDIFIVIFVILLMIIPGYIVRKKKMVSIETVSILSVVLLYISQPFLTIKAFTLTDVVVNKNLLINMLITFVISFVVHFIMFFIIKITIKDKNKLKEGSYMLLSGFSNASFIGIAFVELLTKNSEAVMYACVFMCVFNILIWTLGVFLITNDIRKIKPLKGILNPPVIVLVIAFPMFLFQEINVFKNIVMLGEGVRYFATTTLPISMLIVGIRIADLDIRKVFLDVKLYIVSIMKLIVFPVVTLLLLLPFYYYKTFEKTDPLNYIILVVIMLTSLPSAATIIAMSEEFNGDVDKACEGFVLTTILSVITLPLLLLVVTNYLY